MHASPRRLAPACCTCLCRYVFGMQSLAVKLRGGHSASAAASTLATQANVVCQLCLAAAALMMAKALPAVLDLAGRPVRLPGLPEGTYEVGSRVQGPATRTRWFTTP